MKSSGPLPYPSFLAFGPSSETTVHEVFIQAAIRMESTIADPDEVLLIDRAISSHLWGRKPHDQMETTAIALKIGHIVELGLLDTLPPSSRLYGRPIGGHATTLKVDEDHGPSDYQHSRYDLNGGEDFQDILRTDSPGSMIENGDKSNGADQLLAIQGLGSGEPTATQHSDKMASLGDDKAVRERVDGPVTMLKQPQPMSSSSSTDVDSLASSQTAYDVEDPADEEDIKTKKYAVDLPARYTGVPEEEADRLILRRKASYISLAAYMQSEGAGIALRRGAFKNHELNLCFTLHGFWGAPPKSVQPMGVSRSGAAQLAKLFVSCVRLSAVKDTTALSYPDKQR
ncbi:hypothetical protein K490DRAFT_52659 [Saccharata proteae CBS 121410]|uniref:Uncharacterized protein n=1 Tax=Saccharata proteae CBS 121410 TaxID=1314787 RepID=A0A9P4I0V2_9PEZI|nr:hypothetical protein K490DRAFT_52659 [Saccharata proteae CBS 121410]